MENINQHVLDELRKTNGCTAWHIMLQLRTRLNNPLLTRVDVSQNLQQLKKRKLVKNDGVHWESIAI